MTPSPKKKNSSVLTQELPWEEAIRLVLNEADGALHYAEIAERILSKGLRHSVGATPAATVASILSTSLQKPDSPYLRIGRGEYTLVATTTINTQEASASVKNDDLVPETGALRAFGMYWQREAVYWVGSPSLNGMQGAGATVVNFANQVGVYLLHDRDRVVYVGRATDTLFARLNAHRADRLGGRWDRFSWFGLRSVGVDGSLSDHQLPWNQEVVVETMEALLIESLEPPLNRRRGDNFSAIEYIQAPDENIEKAKTAALLKKIQSNLGI